MTEVALLFKLYESGSVLIPLHHTGVLQKLFSLVTIFISPFVKWLEKIQVNVRIYEAFLSNFPCGLCNFFTQMLVLVISVMESNPIL